MRGYSSLGVRSVSSLKDGATKSPAVATAGL
jgi:hypothetical protein